MIHYMTVRGREKVFKHVVNGEGVKCIPVHEVRKKRVDGMKVDEFIENCDEDTLYLLDIDTYFGKEMNFKVYRELEGIYNLWIDATPRLIEDVMDILISNADLAVITGIYFRDDLEELLELTESVAMKSIFTEDIENFLNVGGYTVITSPIILKELKNVDGYVFRGKEVCHWDTIT